MFGARAVYIAAAVLVTACALEPKREYRPRDGSASAEAEAANSGGGLGRLMRSHLSEVRACFDDGLPPSADRSGRVTLQWDITDAGRARGIVIKESVAPDVDACVINRLREWKFPAPAKGQVERVSYPFTYDGSSITQ